MARVLNSLSLETRLESSAQVINEPCNEPPRWTPNGFNDHDKCDEYYHAPGWLRFGPTKWTNDFLDALATNKTRLTNRQSRRIKEVLDKLGHIPRAHMINFNVDECL